MKNNLKKVIIYPINYKIGGSDTNSDPVVSPNPVVSSNPVVAPLREPLFSPVTIYSNQPINVSDNITNNLLSQIKECDVSELFCLVDQSSTSKKKHQFYQSDEKIKGFIKNKNNFYFNNGTIVGKGSFGQVFKLENLDDSKNDSYVLKDFFNSASYLEEKLASIFIRNLNDKLDDKIRIVDSYWYEYKKNNIILINGFTSDLRNLVEVYKIYNPFQIFLQLVENVYKLYKQDMYYVDLKLGNTLFKDNGHKVDVYMGDIGSIVSISRSETFNLFKSNDLLNSKIKLVHFKDKFFIIAFYVNKKFYYIGYVDIGDNSINAIKEFNNTILTIVQITPKIKVKTESDAEFMIEPFYFISKKIISTFPHFKLPSGVVDIDPSLGKIPYRTLCINNIFHSLVIALSHLIIGTAFKDKYYVSKRKGHNISEGPQDKFELIREYLIKLNQTTDELNQKLLDMIFGSPDLDVEPMFNLNYNENFNDENKIEKVFQNCMDTIKELI